MRTETAHHFRVRVFVLLCESHLQQQQKYTEHMLVGAESTRAQKENESICIDWRHGLGRR